MSTKGGRWGWGNEAKFREKEEEKAGMGSWKEGWEVGETLGSSLCLVGEDVNLQAHGLTHSSKCF